MKLSLFSGLAALASTVAAADLPSVEVVGRKFFYSNNGSQFYIKGVAYQSNSVVNQSGSSFNDPLADTDSVKRDIPYLQKLSTNTIRVYAVNSTLNHDDAMQQLNDAGIYVLADLSEPGLSIEEQDPKWTVDLFNRYISVVDAFAKYPNVLGFIAGNEVINGKNSTQAAPFIKAAIRDVKKYIKQKKYRSVPVGYSASDVQSVRTAEADYLACGDDDTRADFFGTNIYEWCGDSTFEKSGYSARTDEMKNITIPVFFSEYGCNAVTPRKFTDTLALYSSNMTGVWSGGIVYEYFQEVNNYGLVSVSDNSVSTMDDFQYLSSAMQKISPSSASAAGASSSTSEMQCPPTSEAQWVAATNLPPTPDAGICDCLSDSSGCVVKSDVSSKDYSDIFSYLCGSSGLNCDAITANGTSGQYGAFAACSPKQQLNYLMNQYYEKNSKKSSACDFSGKGTLVNNPSTASSCSAYFSQAGSEGTGSISAASTVNAGTSVVGAQATAKASDSGSSGSKSSSTGSSSGSKSKNAAAPNGGNMKVAAGVLGGAVALMAGAL